MPKGKPKVREVHVSPDMFGIPGTANVSTLQGARGQRRLTNPEGLRLTNLDSGRARVVLGDAALKKMRDKANATGRQQRTGDLWERTPPPKKPTGKRR